MGIDYLRAVAAPLCLLGALCLTPPAPAGLLDDGRQAIERGDPRRALTLFSAAAERGDPVGQYALAVLYHDGIGVEIDLRQASALFRAAAERGYAPAQYNLGNAYLNGEGVAQDERQALHWLQQAVDNGFDRARYNLAALLLLRDRSPWQRELAIAHYRYLAERGMVSAYDRLLELDEPLHLYQAELDPRREPQRSEAHLRVLPASRYAIQLFSSSRLELALGWIRRHRLAGRALPVRTERDGKVWFAVLYGDYPTLAEARETLGQLDQPLRAAGPWIRRIDELHRLIDRHNGG